MEEETAMGRFNAYLQRKLGVPELVESLERTHAELQETRQRLAELSEKVDLLDKRSELLKNPALLEILAALKTGGVI